MIQAGWQAAGRGARGGQRFVWKRTSQTVIFMTNYEVVAVVDQEFLRNWHADLTLYPV